MKKTIVLAVLFIVLLATYGHAQQVYDFGGQTVKIWHSLSFDRLYSDNPEGLAYLDWIEKTFNVKLEWGTPGSPIDTRIIDTFVADVMAGDAPDLIRLQTRGLSLCALEGLLRPINDVVDEQFRTRIPAWKINEFDSISKVGESYYGFGADPPQGTGIWWNKEIFEREGFPDPYELYLNGEWTWDVFRDIAIQATRDTTGDGEIDQWGLTGYDNFHEGLPIWLLASNEASTYKIDENGRVVFAMDAPEAMEVWEFLYDLTQVSKVVPLSGVDKRQVFYDGKCAMMAHRTWGARHCAEAGMSDDYSFVPFPKGPNAEEYHAAFNHANVWAIPITSEYETEALVELLYAINKMTEEYMDRDSETEKESWATDFFVMNARDFESVETFNWVIENSEVYTAHDKAYMPEFETAIRAIMYDGEQPASVIASVKEQTQAHLDEFFKQ